MPDDANPGDRNSFLLKPYGDILACYEGVGTLSNDRRSAKCRFTTGQLGNGSVVILCDFLDPASGLPFWLVEPPEKLEGSTVDGWDISASGNMRRTNWLPEVPKRESVCVIAFRAQRLAATRTTRGEAGGTTFGVTNFCYRWPFSVAVEIGTTQLQLEVGPVPDAEQKLNHLRTVGGTDVTTEVRITRATHPHCIEPTLATEVIDDFCHVASVALGTHIQWIFMKQVDQEQRREIIEHYDRFAKPYCSWAVIDPRSAHRDELPQFIISALPQYRKRKDQWGLHQGPIAAYLDAKSEGDYLEQRAAKISVAIESLKAAFLEGGNADVNEFIINENEYSRLVPKLQDACRDVLRKHHSKDTSNTICSEAKLKGLNRRSFRYLLNKLAEHVGLITSSVDISRFVDSRNSLVHTGRFYSDNPVKEWLFLVNMLDRFYLKLLGYSGPYINWTRPADDRRDTLK